jgi:hypothetical protein
MAGYMAAMRIERMEIRIGAVARQPTGDPGSAPATSLPLIELAETDPGEHLQQRLDDLRIYFGQLTWYLFNAEGWR